jgi:micrococcal nuclease
VNARLTLASVALASGLLGRAVHAQVDTTLADTVWVNTRSNVYHCRGMPAFAATSRGQYMSEAEARRRGLRPNGVPTCAMGARMRGITDSASAPVVLHDEQGPSMPDTAKMAACLVTRIHDGDTVTCAGVGRVRLTGVDTPEGNQEPYGTAATSGLAAMLPLGAAARLEYDDNRLDPNRRTLAYVWYQGRLVNWRLVRYGWGVPLHYEPNVRYRGAIDSAQAWARSERRGLWLVHGFDCLPKSRRDKVC